VSLDHGTIRKLAMLIALGLVFRLVLAPLTYGYRYDMNILANWSWHLQNTPLNLFYRYASSPDHLPGDLWFLWWIGSLYRALGGDDFESFSFRQCIKLVPALADCVSALLMFLIVSRFRGPEVGVRTAALYIFNPAIIYVSAIWGQWDALSMCMVLATLWFVLPGNAWWWAPMLAGWAVVIKPPLFPMVCIVLAIPIWTWYRESGRSAEWIRRSVTRIATCSVLAAISAVAVILPFGVGLPGLKTPYQLLDRMAVAIDLYPFRTLSAPNIWMLTQGSLERIDDRSKLIGSMDEHSLGNMLLAIAMAGIAGWLLTLMVRRLPGDPVIPASWAMMLAGYAFFLLPTRVHERYLFPAVATAVLIAGLYALAKPQILLLASVSVLYLANLIVVYGGFRGALPDWLGDIVYGPLLVLLAIGNIGAALATVVLAVRSVRLSGASAAASPN
jgi:hypothetical protein